MDHQAFELEDVPLAYETRSTSSRGATFAAVDEPVLNSHHIMLQRHPLHTAITRARRLVVRVGDTCTCSNRQAQCRCPRAIAVAVRSDEVRRRYAALTTRLGASVCRQEATPF